MLVDTSIVWGWEAIKVDGCLGMDFASWGWGVAVGTVCSGQAAPSSLDCELAARLISNQADKKLKA